MYVCMCVCTALPTKVGLLEALPTKVGLLKALPTKVGLLKVGKGLLFRHYRFMKRYMNYLIHPVAMFSTAMGRARGREVCSGAECSHSQSCHASIQGCKSFSRFGLFFYYSSDSCAC